jgi:DNA helicase HerA-like ATPase
MTPFIKIVLGKRGSGKSYLVKNKLMFSYTECRKIVIIDPNHEYEGLVAENFGDFVNWFREYEKSPFVKIVCRFENDDDISRLFLQAKTIGVNYPVLYVIEETDLFCDPYKIDEHFSKLIRHGRHWKASLICISRRPAELNRLVTSQANEIYVFQFSEPNDLLYLKRTGFNIDDVKKLNPENHEYIMKEF